MTFPVFQTLLFVTLGLPMHVLSYGNGKVEPACVTMEPQHDTTAQTSAAPYTITVDRMVYKTQDTIGVTIKGNTAAQMFEGFLLQARSTSNTPLGTFAINGAAAQTLKCTASADAASHISDLQKNSITINWKPPPGNISNIQMRATIAQNKAIYWMNVKGPVMTYNGTGTSPGTSNGQRLTVSAQSLLCSCTLLLLIIFLRGF
ncbi:putative defense protein Hdd11-like [Lissotriton helveticus]